MEARNIAESPIDSPKPANSKSIVYLGAAFVQAGLAVLITVLHANQNRLWRHQTAILILIFFIGAVIRQFIPKGVRPYSMILTSLVGLFIVFPSVVVLMVLSTLGLVIAIAQSRLNTSTRYITIGLILGAVLLEKGRFVHGASHSIVLMAALLAPIFFLRLICYLRDVEQKPGLVTWRKALSYFTILPGFGVLIFPVIDFKKFTSCESDGPEVLRSGADLMVLGAAQINLARFTTLMFSFPFDKVTSIRTLVIFLLVKYSTYFEISGGFHLCVGMLRLYGYDLPITHRLFIFSRNFNDYWRRTNIYWKDFMVKFIYFPTYFRIRRYGDTLAWVVPTLLVFIASGLLHGYLLYCMYGVFDFSLGDLVFWTAFCIGALTNSYFEFRPDRKALRLEWSIPSLAVSSFKIGGMAVFATVLYAVWYKLNPLIFLAGVSRIPWGNSKDFAWLLVFPAVGIIGALVTTLEYRRSRTPGVSGLVSPRVRSASNFVVLIGILVAISGYWKIF